MNFEDGGSFTTEPSSFDFTGSSYMWLDDFVWYMKESEEYIVTFDGEEYWCVPARYENSEEYAYINIVGNSSLISEDSISITIDREDTGEPFVLYCYAQGGSPSTYLIASTDGEHTISIRTAEETASPFDPKYLPSAEAVADATGDTPTSAEFNALLASLRTAGYLKS